MKSRNEGKRQEAKGKGERPLRELTAADLGDIGWVECAPGEFRIQADLTCADCGAYQAADCDPTRRKDAAVRMTVQLLSAVGWRVREGSVVCPDCVGDHEGRIRE